MDFLPGDVSSCAIKRVNEFTASQGNLSWILSGEKIVLIPHHSLLNASALSGVRFIVDILACLCAKMLGIENLLHRLVYSYHCIAPPPFDS